MKRLAASSWFGAAVRAAFGMGLSANARARNNKNGARNCRHPHPAYVSTAALRSLRAASVRSALAPTPSSESRTRWWFCNIFPTASERCRMPRSSLSPEAVVQRAAASLTAAVLRPAWRGGVRAEARQARTSVESGARCRGPRPSRTPSCATHSGTRHTPPRRRLCADRPCRQRWVPSGVRRRLARVSTAAATHALCQWPAPAELLLHHPAHHHGNCRNVARGRCQGAPPCPHGGSDCGVGGGSGGRRAE